MKWEHRDLRIAYHERGLAGVKALLDAGAKAASAKKALLALEAMGVECSDMREYLDENGMLDRRRKQAAPGERRRYSWSKVKNRRCILLPVDSVLGTSDSNDVEAAFNEDGTIVVSLKGEER